MKKIEAIMALQQTQFVATIIFSGELNPNPEAAAEALRKAGYQVTRMPEEFRPHLAHPRDDFMEVTKFLDCNPEDPMDAAGIMLGALNDLVRRYDALADNCRPIGVDHIPFAGLFDDLTTPSGLG